MGWVKIITCYTINKKEDYIMKKYWIMLFLIIIFFLFYCDNYNIVEPRYFNNNDLIEFPIVEPNIPNEMPKETDIFPYWSSDNNDILYIIFELPKDGLVKLDILNHNGSIFKKLMDARKPSGIYKVTYINKLDKDIYGISIKIDSWYKVLWFKNK